MRLPAAGYRPGKRSLTVTRGIEPFDDAIQGFIVFKFTSPGGVVRFEAPALNFFALRTEFVDTKQEVYDITLRDQHPDTFLPPAGVPVEAHGEFRGIVVFDD